MGMDRNRVAAWVATLGSHPHAPIIRELLSGYDQATGHAAEVDAGVAQLHEAVAAARQRTAVAEEDAARLADWIIRNPSGDPTEVLNLHDRAVR